MVKKDNKSKKIFEKNKKDSSSKLTLFLYITLVVLTIFGLFYLLTVKLLDNGSKDNDSKDTLIQQEEILIGSSFSLKDKEYFILYFDSENEDDLNKLNSAIYNYRMSRKEPYLYTVDMSLPFNSPFVSKESNRNASVASDLKIKGATLIKFKDSKIIEYVEGYDNILNIVK